MISWKFNLIVENLVEGTIKETVPINCICPPCLIQSATVNKGVVYRRGALMRKKILQTILFHRVPVVCVNRRLRKNGAVGEGG